MRTVASERHDIINYQLKRLKAHIETCFYEAKAQGQRRSKSFYEAVMGSFSVLEGDATSDPENTLEAAFMVRYSRRVVRKILGLPPVTHYRA